MPLSIIVPSLNDASVLQSALQALQSFRARHNEVLVVDGGSRDGSVTIARQYADRVLMSGAGRALQMNAGSEYASHDTLLFLPIDVRLPDAADALVEQALQGKEKKWGYFERSAAWLPALAAAWSNWGADASGLATLDHAIFVTRSGFEQVKGFDMVTTDEGQALSAKLLQLARPVCIKTPVTTVSGRP